MQQTILYGIEHFPGIANKKYMLVCGRSFSRLLIRDYFHPAVQFSDFSPNPLYEQVCKGVALFRETQCDGIVAVGGGSAIDVAKCIKLFCKMDPAKNYLTQEFIDSDVPLIAIPTTAGTGSESTRHAVIYFEGAKQSVSHASILPDYAILEPSMLITLPIYQKKCTMLDALCQGIESWWSVNSTEESKFYAKCAVDGVVANWRDYIENNTAASAKAIMQAANDSGRAIHITATTAAHAMSYKLTSLYGLPHGHAVAICLPEVWDYLLAHTDACIDKRGSAYLDGILDAITECVSVTQFREMLEKLGMTYPVSQNREAEMDALTRSVNPVRLQNNPVALDSETLRNMYGKIVK